MTPDETTDPAAIRNSWDDDEPAAPTEARIDLLRAVRDDRQRIWEELVVLRAKVARVEALAHEFATDAPLSDWRADDVAKAISGALDA